MKKPTSQVINISRGSVVWYDGEAYTITALMDLKTVLAKAHEDGQSRRLQVSKLKASKIDSTTINAVNLVDISQKSWDLAQKRFEAIRPLLEKPKHFRTAEDVQKRAKIQGVNRATIYRWLDAYEASGLLSALGRPSRVDRGRSRMNAEVEELINDAIQELYLHHQRIKVSSVVEEVELRCRKKGLKAPHANTIRNRVNALPEVLKVRARNGKQAAKAYDPLQGHFPGAEWPLAYVQIDHTPLDIILVDDETRNPIGRPYITLAIDIYSRMVTGFYLSYDPPSCFTVGMCIAHSVLPKDACVAEHDLRCEWPIEGKMKVLHVDNALEFRSDILQRACDQHQIDIQWRPVREPQYGGHVERVFRTINTKIHELPGTTFSNVKERDYYQSEKYSAFTLAEFEVWLTTFIVDKYHPNFHTEINMSPLKRYEKGILGDGKTLGAGMPPRVVDRESFRIDFMPSIKRTIQNYGMRNDKIYYYHDILRPWINVKEPENSKRKRRFVFHYDPRDISKFYFWDPELKQYYTIPYRDNTRPPISLWELRAANKKAREDGYAEIDEDILFDAYERLKQMTVNAVNKTKTQRKKQLREKQRKSNHHRQISKIQQQDAKSQVPALNLVKEEDDANYSDFDITPFTDINE